MTTQTLEAWREKNPGFAAPGFPLQSLSLKERIRMARKHMEQHGHQIGELWPHHRFSMTISELLEAAARAA